MFLNARTGLTVNINVNVSTESIPRDNLTTEISKNLKLATSLFFLVKKSWLKKKLGRLTHKKGFRNL